MTEMIPMLVLMVILATVVLALVRLALGIVNSKPKEAAGQMEKVLEILGQQMAASEERTRKRIERAGKKTAEISDNTSEPGEPGEVLDPVLDDWKRLQGG